MKNKGQDKKEMPIVRAIKILSWILAAGGSVSGMAMIVLRFSKWGMVIGVWIMVIALAGAALLRILGVIGQILFEMSGFLYKCLNDMRTRTDQIYALTSSMSIDIREQREKLCSDSDKLVENIAKISCDSKELNKNIHEIRNFFNQIAKRLDMHE